jgi:hypothetical protein
MKVLMICIEFPPINTTGNFRSAGLARFMSKTGVKPVILTAEEESAAEAFNKKVDFALLKGLEDVKIYRFPIESLSKLNKNKYYDYFRIWYNAIDSIGKRWYKGDNKREIHNIILTEKPDLLYVSLPPFGMAKVAIKLSKKFNLPLITDMRDAWSLWCSAPYSTRIHYYIVKRIERKLFETSKLIISTSEEMTSDFIKSHNTIDPAKFKTIYNGYDEFDEIDSSPKIARATYIIGYVGGFYYDPKVESLLETKWYKRKGLKKFYFTPRREYWKYRSPYFFLKALQALIEQEPILKDKVRFDYIGRAPYWLDAMLKEFGLSDNFVNHGFLAKNKVLEIQATWDSILATSEKVIDGKHYTIPSKSFDSIKLQKPILAFVTPGSQYNFLKNYKQSVFFDPDNTQENVETLKSIVSGKLQISFDALSDDFTRENQAEKLLQLINKIKNL